MQQLIYMSWYVQQRVGLLTFTIPRGSLAVSFHFTTWPSKQKKIWGTELVS